MAGGNKILYDPVCTAAFGELVFHKMIYKNVKINK